MNHGAGYACTTDEIYAVMLDGPNPVPCRFVETVRLWTLRATPHSHTPLAVPSRADVPDGAAGYLMVVPPDYTLVTLQELGSGKEALEEVRRYLDELILLRMPELPRGVARWGQASRDATRWIAELNDIYHAVAVVDAPAQALGTWKDYAAGSCGGL